MRFPTGNKIKQEINEGFGKNVALLEEKMKNIDWRWFFFFYCAAFVMFCLSLFILIVVIKAAWQMI